MKCLMPILCSTEDFLSLETVPAILQPYLPQWPNSHCSPRTYSFGIAVHVALDDPGDTALEFHLFNSRRATTFPVSLEEGGLFLVCLRAVNTSSAHTTWCLRYMPGGEQDLEIPIGISSFLLISLDTIAHGLNMHRQLIALRSQVSAFPDQTHSLTEIQSDEWLTAATNFLFNYGREDRTSLNITTQIRRLLQMYLLAVQEERIRDYYFSSQLHHLAGRESGTPHITYHSVDYENYLEIITYLQGHIRYHYSRGEIARKSQLTEKQFAKLFKAGYGKPYKEGMLEIRMGHALQLVVRDKKLSEVAASTGYASASSFTAEFRKFFGYPPSLFQWPYRQHRYRKEE